MNRHAVIDALNDIQLSADRIRDAIRERDLPLDREMELNRYARALAALLKYIENLPPSVPDRVSP
jgi:hypothetical protein